MTKLLTHPKHYLLPRSIVGFLLICAVVGCTTGLDASPYAATLDGHSGTAPSNSSVQNSLQSTLPSILREGTQTPDPVPTLVEAAALKLTAELLRTNGNCRLPCWWGFSPGSSRWATVEEFLQRFSDVYSFKTSETAYIHRVNSPLPDDISTPGLPLSSIYTEQNGVIEGIEVQLNRTTLFNLPTVLADYGQPGEVWISWLNTKPNSKGYFPLFVFLYYPTQGFLVEYMPNKLIVSGHSVIGCPQAFVYPEMYLWSPESTNGSRFADVINQTELFGKGLQYLPLEKAAGMDVETFYRTFVKPDNARCLQTPFDLWPKGNNPFE